MLGVLLTLSSCTFGDDPTLLDASTGHPSVDAGGSNRGDAGAPPEPLRIEVGTGESAFQPLDDGDVVVLEYGIQGGHHLWAAARIGDATLGGITLTATLEDRNGEIYYQRYHRAIEALPADIVGMRVLVEPDRVDTSSVSLTVTVIDARGRSGRDRRVLRLSTDQ